ncbi:MAG: T9SS type A sorting domain-containing protein [Saprospiraceae bacterium]|nr:T9SS type A sorting domain-containing protein [Saprospiraceae bacterium]
MLKSNNAILIDGKKLFIAVTKHTRTNEFIFATRPQGQNDIYFYRETIDGVYIESAHLINPNRSVYALQPYNLLQTNDDGIVLTGSFVLDTFKLGNISPFQVGGWPVIMKLSAETLGLPTATSDPWQQPTFSIAPNPSTNQITITTSEALSNSRIEIYDQIGRNIINHQISSSATEINISSLPTGLYFVSLVDDLGKRFGQVQKLVKIE